MGAFEVRTYDGLIRHWRCSRLAMCFLAEQTRRLRGEKLRITFEQVAAVSNTLAPKIWQTWPRSWTALIRNNQYYQQRNEASYASRRKHLHHMAFK